jgi:uncharacterized Zn finger protein (UPF0148 family)
MDMTCGACGAPIARGLVKCPFCGASVKYAITDSGALPYEYVPEAAERQKEPEPPEPRWDLEAPAGNSHSYYRAMRLVFERWAALERRRRVARGPLGCAVTSVVFVIFAASCAVFSLVSSQARMPGVVSTPSAEDITATATANPDPYVPEGLLTLDNLLDENSNAAWMNYTSDSRPINQGCTFQNGSYDTSKSTQPTPGIRACLANGTNFSNFAYQIEMQSVQGQSGGLVFRASTPDHFYYFYINVNGYYALWLNTGAGAQGRTLIQGKSQFIRQGNYRLNILAVVADGPTLKLYDNYALLTTVQDETYSSGKIGTAVGAPDTLATECLFNNAKVWSW